MTSLITTSSATRAPKSVTDSSQSQTIISLWKIVVLVNFWVTQFLTMKKTLNYAYVPLVPHTRNPS